VRAMQLGQAWPASQPHAIEVGVEVEHRRERTSQSTLPKR
jgi:hypothetical protein